jgi:DNA-binding CsgD family transcriptional regulator
MDNDPFEVRKELELLKNENQKLSSVVHRLEQHIINLIIPVQSIQQLHSIFNKPVPLDDRNVASLFRQFSKHIQEFIEFLKVHDLSKISVQLTPYIEAANNLSRTLGEMKFMARRLDDIEKEIKKISKDGIDKHVKLDLTLDGYTMVKKQINHDPEVPIEDPNKALDELLKSLTQRQKQVLIYFYGLCGEKSHSFKEMGKKLGLSASTLKVHLNAAIRNLRPKTKKDLVAKINHRALYKEITGNELTI